jgi:hypothetical protein
MNRPFLKEKTIIKEGNISLILESYEDLFSDFDPRPYSEKALSEDFLAECKRASRDKGQEEIELRFLIPKKKRNLKDEKVIVERLKEHFRKHFIEKNREIKSYQKAGILWISLGIFIIITSVFVSLNFESHFLETILKIFEVPSWFLIWEGLGKIFIHAKEKFPEYDFNKKMHSSEINFYNY